MGNFVVETERNFRISDLLTEEQMPKVVKRIASG